MKKTTTKPALTPHKKTALRKPTSITIDPAVWAQIDARGDNRSERITQDLSRYYRLLAEVRPAMRERITPAELSLILDACNGWAMEADAPRHLWMEIADSIRLNGADKKWEVADAAGLVQRLRDLTWLESLALCDAVERFWQAVGEGDHTRDPARALD